MQSRDIFCARGTPCEVCSEWSEETWRRWDSAIISASRKKAKQAWLAQQRASQLAGTTGPVHSKGLAPVTPSAPVEAAPGPKSRAVPTLTRPPLAAPALGPKSRSSSAPAVSHRIPAPAQSAPAQLDVRIILPGRGSPVYYPARHHSPSPRETQGTYRQESGERLMPPPPPPRYDDQGRSRRERERGGKETDPWGQTVTGPLGIGSHRGSVALGGPSLLVHTPRQRDLTTPLAESPKTLLLVVTIRTLPLPRRSRIAWSSSD